MIPLTEQCRAVLFAETWELAQKYCGGDHDKLMSGLTISREDLRNYIADFGYPKGWWRFEPAAYDGLYTIEQNQVWIVYFQERGRIDHQFPQKFATRAEAEDFVLDNVYLRKK